jgi:hypothetical protein
MLTSLLRDGDVQRFIGVNRYQDVLWFNKERFDDLLWWMYLILVIQTCADPDLTPDKALHSILTDFELIKRLQQAEDGSGFQVEKLIEVAHKPIPTA